MSITPNSKYTVGAKIYGGTRMSPHVGKGSVDKAGYKARDARARMKQQVLRDQMNRKGK